MLGHELRNPLSPILTALQLLEIQGDFRREHEVIERQARHLARLVDDLLDVARITSGQLELRRRKVELIEIVARGIEQAGPMIEKHRHRLLKDVPASGLEVHVDPARLAQVAGNLLTNAAKYTSPGGRIVITGRRDADGNVVMTISDDGPGIPREILPTLFEPFSQARQDIDRSHGGLGLGLTIVHSLVVAHGGTVAVDSEPNEGTTFTVTLPRPATLAADASANDALRLSLPPPSRRVLIVEDNPDAALMLSQALRLVGHHVETVFDPAAALELAPSFQPEVCVLDIGLPVMDGYELARRLRRLPSLDGVRLIALTGYGQDSDRRLAREAGFERHVLKPVDLRLLRSLIEQDFTAQ
jgi:CheY-like chemotaxis protein/anti-sigma regulatory factor (Ser/Thr protein kinase)